MLGIVPFVIKSFFHLTYFQKKICFYLSLLYEQSLFFPKISKKIAFFHKNSYTINMHGST